MNGLNTLNKILETNTFIFNFLFQNLKIETKHHNYYLLLDKKNVEALTL